MKKYLLFILLFFITNAYSLNNTISAIALLAKFYNDFKMWINWGVFTSISVGCAGFGIGIFFTNEDATKLGTRALIIGGMAGLIFIIPGKMGFCL